MGHPKCPICDKPVKEAFINQHIDSGCQDNIADESLRTPSTAVSGFFQPPSRIAVETVSKPLQQKPSTENGVKRKSLDEGIPPVTIEDGPSTKRPKTNHLRDAAPLADRMRPTSLDDVCGQELVGPSGVIRGLIEQGRVPSMILWGSTGTGKTTIARIIAHTVGSRFVEINATSSSVVDLKKIFSDSRNDLQLTGRKTILFCDEIHRFSKTQQDVFLGPVEAGQITLIGATTENPSFKLSKLSDEDILAIMNRAIDKEGRSKSELLDDVMLRYLAAFADGDARTGLNLLDLSMNLAEQPGMTVDKMKSSLTQTMVYDRAGDQHYDVS
jgi:putative ATPase